MAYRPRFQPRYPPMIPNYAPEYIPLGVRPNFPVRPAPARFPAAKRPMPAAESTAVKRMRMIASAVMPASSSVENQQQNPISLLNQYQPGLNYHVVGESGPPHLKIFSIELTVDGQVFRAVGDSKSTARFNVAQNAVNVLGEKIVAEIERRKAERQEKFEARKAEREERLKKQEEESEASSSNADVKQENPETLNNGIQCTGTEQKPPASSAASAGTEGDDQEQKGRIKGKSAVRVLKDIRPGISCVEKVITDAPVGQFAAQVVVDGQNFEGQGDSLSLAKAQASASALSNLFNMSFEYSPRGFPIYTGDAKEYMHLRQSDLITASADEKNAINVLNELYYESAVYKEQKSEGFSLVSVTVDGITTYGRGATKKEAKLSAANAAIEQLRTVGLLQQRIAEKDALKIEKKGNVLASERPASYRQTVSSAESENAIAKLNHVYSGLNYNVTDAIMTPGETSFTVSVNVNGQVYSGTGRSKKTARLTAAENALRGLNLWTENSDAKQPTAHSFGGETTSYAGGQSFRARGSGILRTAVGRGPSAAATNVAGNVGISQDKNPIMVLNEVYYSAAIYEYQPCDPPVMGRCCCIVKVDGITAYGNGPSKKEAKSKAARAAVQELEATGLLQQRIADKSAFLSNKYSAGQSRGVPAQHAAQSRGVQRQRSTRGLRGGPVSHGGLVPRGGPKARGAQVSLGARRGSMPRGGPVSRGALGGLAPRGARRGSMPRGGPASRGARGGSMPRGGPSSRGARGGLAPRGARGGSMPRGGLVSRGAQGGLAPRGARGGSVPRGSPGPRGGLVPPGGPMSYGSSVAGAGPVPRGGPVKIENFENVENFVDGRPTPGRGFGQPQSYYPQETLTDFTTSYYPQETPTDFTKFDTSSFMSFDDTTPSYW